MKKPSSKNVKRTDNAAIQLNCVVNGQKVSKTINSGLTLLEFLRRELGLTGTKEACGQGECGACVVLVDERPVNSCLFMAAQAEGKKILTVEGLRKNGELHPLQKAFVAEGAVQCGFCTPGFLMTSYALLKSNPKASREDIVQALSGNICRCTGYEKIFAAVEQVRDGKYK